MRKQIFLDIVADYGGTSGLGDLAFMEVRRAFLDYLYQKDIMCLDVANISTHSFNTIETGFAVAQLAFNRKKTNNPPLRVIFHNTAPRKDDNKARENNAGEPLAITFMPSENTIVVGVFAGYCFSFFAKEEIIHVPCEVAGSQFRSRDIFPEAVSEILANFFASQKSQPRDKFIHGVKTYYESKGIIKHITNLTPNAINDCVALYIDGFGNIKNNLPTTDLADAKTATIKGITHKLYTSNDGVFGVPEGSLVLAEGSSKIGEKRFLELVLRGGSASELFGGVIPGDKIIIG